MEVVVFDTETNALSPSYGDILSVGWLKAIKNEDNWKIIKHVEHLVYNPNIHNHPKTLEVNKITDEDRMNRGIPINEILNEFKQDIKGCDIYACNYQFDVRFLKKYDENILDEVKSVKDIRIYGKDSVLNSIQRITYQCFHGFTARVKINKHLHSALDDVFCEFIILLHDQFGENVESYFESCAEYEPVIVSNPYKGQPISQVNANDRKWLEEYVNQEKPNYQNYLREFIKAKYF